MSEKPCLSRHEDFFFSPYVHLCGTIWQWNKSGDAHRVSCNIMQVPIRQTVHTCICPSAFAGFDRMKLPLCKAVVITCSHNKSLAHQTSAAAVEVTLSVCAAWGLRVLLCQMLNYRVFKKKSSPVASTCLFWIKWLRDTTEMLFAIKMLLLLGLLNITHFIIHG